MDHTQDGSLQLEIAHVVFIDIVGYSRRPMEDQPRLLDELQGLVRRTAPFRRAQGAGDLLCLPTGDGMALVFFRDPVAALHCAMHAAKELRSRPGLTVRMGLHTGPVYRVADINANANVSGGGINLAQRVMDCGDANHILLSAEIVGQLRQVGSWPIHELGQCEVKHGVVVHLYNLHTAEVGNAQVPTALRGPQRPAGAAADTLAAASAVPSDASDAPRVALLYKRHLQPDEHLLHVLEAQLRAHGYSVFIDRHLSIGVEWAREIEREVRSAHAVVPLLSSGSAQSEMLTYEVQIAHEERQKSNGRPRMLPVRINYTGPLPEPLAGILDPLEYALWMGPQDDDRLVADVINSLADREDRSAVRGRLESVGGAVPLDSKFYVVRATDEDFGDAIDRQDSIVLVKGARQMGKTSLIARGLQRAREAGARVVFTDFQLLNSAQLESPESLYLTLAETIADQLDLDVYPGDVWRPERGPNINLRRYLQREVLGKLGAPLVWGIDEADRLFACDYGSEVFGLFRSWHNERALNPMGPWASFTMVIAYATEAHLFITDVNQSPFNVGTRIALEDFTFEQVADLNRRHGEPLRDSAEVARFCRLVSGQPYLVRRGLHEMTAHDLDIGALEAQAQRDEGIFGDHLRRMLVLLAREPALLEVIRDILRGRTATTAEAFYRLRSAGIIAGDSAREARPRCQLYATYLERHLL